MINEFIQLSKVLKNTGIILDPPIHPYLKQISNETVLVRINNSGKIVSISTFSENQYAKLLSLKKDNDGKLAGYGFPSFNLTPDRININKYLISNWIPKIINTFKNCSELSNLIKTCEIFKNTFNYDEFVNGIKQHYSKYNPEEKLPVFIELETYSDGCYISNTEFWNKIKSIIYKKIPINTLNTTKGVCWFTQINGELKEPKNMEIQCSKKLFNNGVSLYNKNIGKRYFSNNDKIKIGQSLYDEITAAGEWILSDERYNKNSYVIEKLNSALVCYSNLRPSENTEWANIICNTPNLQDISSEEIQSLMKNVLNGNSNVINNDKLSYFILKKVNKTSFIISGNGTVNVSKLIDSIKKWNSSCLIEKLGLLDAYKFINNNVKGKNIIHTIEFNSLFDEIFINKNINKCNYILTELLNRFWLDIIKNKIKEREKILSLINIMNTYIKTDQPAIDFSSIGKLCYVADNLNQLYNTLQLNRHNSTDLYCGYETMRSIEHGYLSVPLNRLLNDIIKYMDWAKKYNGENVALVKFYYKKAVDLFSDVKSIKSDIDGRILPLTVSERSDILLSYGIGINDNKKESTK